jgi:hypothetical protein
LWWALPLGALLGLALQLANQAPETEAGHGSGLPALLGARTSRWCAVVAFTVACTAATALLLLEGERWHALAATACSAGTLALLPRWRAFGADGLFGVLAVGAAAVAIAFLGAA